MRWPWTPVFPTCRRGVRTSRPASREPRNIVLDAGALVAADRDDRRVAGLIELGRRAGAELVTSAPVVGQAWRGGSRQARLARLLKMVDVRVTVVADARAAGALLAQARTPDVVDALLTLVALPGDQILTRDPDDVRAALDDPVTRVRQIKLAIERTSTVHLARVDLCSPARADGPALPAGRSFTTLAELHGL